ncbi:tRNA pseudouridine(55) synthase TruB [Rothia mucilaginosa]|uniref:tRNA pseudouridine(55) synthase TruB n=1 Tax=Rothia mucilaginosa TaxID=43675 RepID=UPI0026EB9BD6|nr:tRNA pseudouridine(55) synthase TruB [Rothia mucilaginosa]
MAKKQPQGPSGLMVIDKPAGMSSHDAVSQMRRIAGTRRVGHAGTLDPAATGVLILGINKATKLLTYLVGQDKTYDATIRLGIETLTEDAEGEHNAAHPDAVEALTGLDAEQMRARILEAVAQLSGDILQVPSAVSAIKINGVRSYARVRSGEQVELAARPVTISEFTVHSVTPGFAEYVIEDPENEGEHAATSVPVIDCEVTVSCSSGTYIRALARDLGKILGTGGHLTALRRTRVGAVVLEDAADLALLKQRREESEAPLEDLPLLPLEEAARRIFGARELSAAEASDISYGRRISPSGDGSVVKRSVHASADESGAVQHASVEGIVAGFAPDGTLVALLENKKQRGKVLAAPVLVFEANRSFN